MSSPESRVRKESRWYAKWDGSLVVGTGDWVLAAPATPTASPKGRAVHCRTTQISSDAGSATATPALEMRIAFRLSHVMPNSARPPMRAVSAVLRERAQRQTPWADGVAWTTKQHATKSLAGEPASTLDPQHTVLVTPALAAAPQPIVLTVVGPVHPSLATSRTFVLIRRASTLRCLRGRGMPAARDATIGAEDQAQKHLGCADRLCQARRRAPVPFGPS